MVVVPIKIQLFAPLVINYKEIRKGENYLTCDLYD